MKTLPRMTAWMKTYRNLSTRPHRRRGAGVCDYQAAGLILYEYSPVTALLRSLRKLCDVTMSFSKLLTKKRIHAPFLPALLQG